MKYIVKDEQIKHLMKNIVDAKVSDCYRRDADSYIVIHQNYEQYIDDVLFEYDHFDKTLWVDEEYRRQLETIFPFGRDFITEFLRDWFENHYNVEVKSVRG